MELLNMVKLGTMGFKPADIKAINASGIESDQIIELAKAGYQATDVNELIKLAQEEPKPQPEEKPDEKPDNPSEAAGADDKLNDIQKKLEETEKKLAEQTEALKKAQSKNASKDLGAGNQKSAQDLVRESLRTLY
jgi:hypothetical protein